MVTAGGHCEWSLTGCVSRRGPWVMLRALAIGGYQNGYSVAQDVMRSANAASGLSICMH